MAPEKTVIHSFPMMINLGDNSTQKRIGWVTVYQHVRTGAIFWQFKWVKE